MQLPSPVTWQRAIKRKTKLAGGLATLGGGSVASGGLGMAGGIFVVAAAPSILTSHAMYNLCSTLENDAITPRAVAVGGVGGALAGSGEFASARQAPQNRSESKKFVKWSS